jgi:hypothetical protein
MWEVVMDRWDASFALLRRSLVALPLAAAAALCLASPAGAGVMVGVEAGSLSNGPYAIDNENSPLPTVVSAAAGASAVGGGVPFNDAILNPGPLPGCALSCVSLPGSSTGLARAEANGLTGELKVRAEALGESAFGGGLARLQDTITFLGAKEVNLEVDVNTFASPASSNSIQFFFSLGFFDNNDPDNPFTIIYLFESDENGYTATLGGTTIDSGTSIPGSIEVTVDLAPFMLVVNTAQLEIRMSALAQCDDTPCQAYVAADNSLHMTIDGPYISAEGYNYDALVVAVSEPASGLALAASLAGLWWSRRRRTARAQ